MSVSSDTAFWIVRGALLAPFPVPATRSIAPVPAPGALGSERRRLPRTIRESFEPWSTRSPGSFVNLATGSMANFVDEKLRILSTRLASSRVIVSGESPWLPRVGNSGV